MPRYIDADAIHYVEIGKGVEIALASDIDKIPTISHDDVRGVVHCKDCKFGEHSTDGNGNHCVLCGNSMVFDYPYAHDPDWFCADGEMKGAEENHTMDEFMYGQEMGSHSDGSL